jgi:hypothetical protein
LSDRFQDMSPAQIRAELAIEGIDADAAENFFRDIGRAASSIGSAIAPRLGGIVQGAISGASTGAIAGPYGMLAGALLGGVTGGLSAPARPGAPGAAPPGGGGGGGPLGALGGILGSLGGRGGAGAGGAAGTLLGLLNQPGVTQGLMAMLLGKSGSGTVPVAGQNVPVAAIPNMIAHFANQAAAEWEQVHGAPTRPTLEGLPESADSGERAEALAQAFAVDAILRDASAEQEAEASEWFDAGEMEAAEAEMAELSEWYGASYEPVYMG